MLLATGLDVVGHGAASVGSLGMAPPASSPTTQRLVRRIVGAAFLLALAGIGLAFPMV